MKAKFQFTFKYDYLDLFICFACFTIGSLISYIIMYYIFNYPKIIIIEDIWPMIQRCAVMAVSLNLYYNIKKINNSLNNCTLKSQTTRYKKKLSKAYPRYCFRTIPFSKETTE